MATVAPAADQATDLLQKLYLDPKSEAGEAKQAKGKVSAALNGVVANPNPQVASAEQWAATVPEDYKDVGMYFGAYPYYSGGWGDCSVYVSHDGAEALTPTSQSLQTLGLTWFNPMVNPFKLASTYKAS